MICAVGEVCRASNAPAVSGLSPVAVGSVFGRFLKKKEEEEKKRGGRRRKGKI